MHELLLFGQVPARSQDLVLKVLAGISATQPRVHSSQHLIFKPIRTPSSVVAAAQAARANKPGAAQLGTQQSTDIFYLQLVGHLSEKEAEETLIKDEDPLSSDSTVGKTEAAPAAGDGTPSLKTCPWSLEFRDLPAVVDRRKVTSRMMASTRITNGAPMELVEAMGFV